MQKRQQKMHIKYMELVREMFNGNEVIKIIDLNKLQKEIYKNKVDKGFNITDINKEFCLTYGEVAEAYEDWKKRKMI